MPDLLHRPDATEPELISSFDLITPLNPGICETASSWQNGSRRVMPGDHIASGECLAVEMNLLESAFVFLVNQDAKGELTRMFPSECRGLGNNDALLHPGKQFQFPSPASPNAGVLKVGGYVGMEIVYAIVIARPNLADSFAARLDGIQGLCSAGQAFPKDFGGQNGSAQERIHSWQDYLNRWAVNNPGLIQWREIRFWHDPS